MDTVLGIEGLKQGLQKLMMVFIENLKKYKPNDYIMTEVNKLPEVLLKQLKCRWKNKVVSS